MNSAVVLTGLLTGISVVAFAAPAACPTCADTEKTECGVDIVVANTAPVAEPDWEVLLQSRVREADRLGLLRKAQRETADNMKRHAETPVDLKLPRAKATESRRLVLLDEASVRAMAEPVKAVFAGFDNYVKVFQNKEFLKSLGNVCLMTFFIVILQVLISFIFANVLVRVKNKFGVFVRTIIYLPY